MNRFSLPYPTLKDDSILLGFHNSLIANAIPSTVIIDKSGKVVAVETGFGPEAVPIFEAHIKKIL